MKLLQNITTVQKREHYYAILTSQNDFKIMKLTIYVNLHCFFMKKLKKKKITSLICFYKQKFAKTRSPFISLTSTKLIQRLGLIFHSPPSYYVISPCLSYSKVFPHILPKLLLSDLFLFSRNYLKSPPTLVLLDTSLLSC